MRYIRMLLVLACAQLAACGDPSATTDLSSAESPLGIMTLPACNTISLFSTPYSTAIAGTTVSCNCPSNSGTAGTYDYALNRYHANTSICTAAQHQGVLTGGSGDVTLTIQDAFSTYVCSPGCTQNGVTEGSGTSMGWARSYNIARY